MGDILGYVNQLCTCGTRALAINDATGNEVMRVTNDVCACTCSPEFEVTNRKPTFLSVLTKLSITLSRSAYLNHLEKAMNYSRRKWSVHTLYDWTAENLYWTKYTSSTVAQTVKRYPQKQVSCNLGSCNADKAPFS